MNGGAVRLERSPLKEAMDYSRESVVLDCECIAVAPLCLPILL